MLLSPDLRAAQHVALGALFGLIASLPAGFIAGFQSGVLLAALSVAAFVASGWYQILMQPKIADVPSPPPSIKYAVDVAIDNLVLGFFSFLTPIPSDQALDGAIAETKESLELIKEKRLTESPLDHHQTPETPPSVSKTSEVIHRIHCEIIEYDSNYQPIHKFPSYDRWLAYEENKRCKATLLRQTDPKTPWMICLHGFGMGDAKNDLTMLQADKIYEKGINVALFTLPVHGHRSPSKLSGSAFMGLSPLDYLHAKTQAIWDLRQLISLIRAEGGEQIGVYGVSLGAYTASLLASIEEDLSCVIAGVPAIGVIANRELLASNIERRIPTVAGLNVDDELAIHSLVSPLHLQPLVPHAHRYIYAGTGDQIVPPEHVKTLWEHWERPEITWCKAAHATAMKHPDAQAMIERAIRESFS